MYVLGKPSLANYYYIVVIVEQAQTKTFGFTSDAGCVVIIN